MANRRVLVHYRDRPDARRRFVAEARVGSRLQHPAIVPVYELGWFDDRRPYIWLANDDSVAAVDPKWEGFENTPQGPFNELNIISLTTVHKK